MTLKKLLRKENDRICINNLFLINSLSIKNIAFALGSQSLLVSIDIIKKEDNFFGLIMLEVNYYH